MLRGFRTRVLALFALAVMVVPSGCSKDVVKPSDDMPVVHPELPQPVNLSPIDWKVYEVDGQPVIGTSKQEFGSHMENQNEVLRFIRESRQSLCFYRDDLDEDFCAQK